MPNASDSDLTEKKFPVELPIRIDWSEMDLYGHVNNVSYFKYIQASRVQYWDAVNMLRFFETDKRSPILASSQCNFKQPLHFPGNIVVQCRMQFVKNTSFGFEHRLLNELGEIAAEAADVMVFFDFKNHRKCPIPTEIRTDIEQLEQRPFSL